LRVRRPQETAVVVLEWRAGTNEPQFPLAVIGKRRPPRPPPAREP
jgi:hypothetical protein